MKLMKQVTHIFTKMKYYLIDYFMSGIVFQLIRFALVVPLSRFLFNTSLSNAGISAITDQTVFTLLKNPISVIGLLAMLLLLGISIYIELGFYFILSDYQRKGKPYSLSDILVHLQKKIKYFFSAYSILFIFYFLIIMPLSPLGFQSEITTRLYIPTFIVDELLLTTKGAIIYFAFFGVILYVSLRLIYSVYYFVVDDDITIIKALKKSWNTSRRQTLRNIWATFVVSFCYIVILFFFIFLAAIPFLLADAFARPLVPFFGSLSTTLIQIILVIGGGLITPIIINLIVDFSNPNEERRVYKSVKTTKAERAIMASKYTKMIVVVAVIITTAVNYYQITKDGGVFIVEAMVVAHRGNKDEAVENSMTSLLDSIAVGADMMELDIQETKDQKLVVMHDYDLKRMAGINKKIYDMTWDELSTIQIRQNGYTDHISLLDEFFDVAKQYNFKLLVEIKPHGYESDEMTQNLVNLIHSKGVKDLVIIQSLDLDAIDAVKAIDPGIETCYVLPLVIGQLPITNHDYIALEDFSFRKKTISEAKTTYKGVFAWTIDDKLSEYLMLDITGVITNQPKEAIELKELFADQSVLYRILRRLSFV